MKIYFCDTCNESIPLQDIKDNKAATLKGKIYCKNCNPLKEIEMKAGRAPGNTSIILLLIVIVILVGAGLGMMLVNQFGQKDEFAKADDLRASRVLFQQVSEDLEELGRELEALKGALEEDRGRYSKMESELLVVRGDLQGVRSETENMSKNFQSVTNVRERLDQFMLKQDEFTTSLAEHETRLSQITAQTADLNSRYQDLTLAVSQGTTVAVPADTSSQDDPSNFVNARVEEIQKKLQSKDDGVRYEAVCDVLDERLKGALPFVLPCIEDTDQFVQIMAIQTVGEFLYMDALPSLIKVLRDPDVTVRYEALRQLVRMSGQSDLDFDVHASESEREKAIKKWEKWMKDQD